MSPFFSHKDSYLGVDIGTASIKVVELKNEGGRSKLETYGYIDIVTDIIRSNTLQTRQTIINALKKVIASARVTTDKAVAALPTFSVFNSIINLPPMSKKDLDSAVKWEAKKYVPLPLEEMILDWKIIDDFKEAVVKKEALKLEQSAAVRLAIKRKGFNFFGKKGATAEPQDFKKQLLSIDRQEAGPAGSNIRILVTAAPKNLVSRYLEIFKAVGLKLLSLETEAFALARSLIGNDPAIIMIVDVGSITTDICIIEKGIPILNRSIDIGGLSITKAIAGSLNVNVERAEQFKRDFGINIDQEIKQKGISKTILNSLSPIINEIKYVLDLYQGQGQQRVEKIVLSGGSSFLPNLASYFTELFNKPTIIGNPWEKVIYPEDLKPVLNELGPRLAVAIGLAQRDI